MFLYKEIGWYEMHSLKLANLEANVLDEDEFTSASQIILANTMGYLRRNGSDVLHTEVGQRTFNKIIEDANYLSINYDNIQEKEKVVDVVNHINWANSIEEICGPGFFTLSEITGRLLLIHAKEGDKILKDKTRTAERKNLVMNNQIREYEEAEKKFEKVDINFNLFAAGKTENIEMYRTVIFSEIAEIDLNRVNSIKIANEEGIDDCSPTIHMRYAKKCATICSKLFEEGYIFPQDIAAVACANKLAFALRHLPSRENINLTISYLEATQKYFPDDIRIENVLREARAENVSEAERTAKRYNYYKKLLD